MNLRRFTVARHQGHDGRAIHPISGHWRFRYRIFHNLSPGKHSPIGFVFSRTNPGKGKKPLQPICWLIAVRNCQIRGERHQYRLV
ncbi:hypothetical protein KCP78_06700 [Salmonella enterica subsp. enterica]|nr:hypothetical protein KCP78_06700 [Salmonella enterica subsp. enterica]